MEYCVLDFVVATDSPYLSDYQEPESIIAMLTNDLVAIDCKTNGYPCYKNPYAMDFNESPVTCCRYLVDCPGKRMFHYTCKEGKENGGDNPGLFLS